MQSKNHPVDGMQYLNRDTCNATNLMRGCVQYPFWLLVTCVCKNLKLCKFFPSYKNLCGRNCIDIKL